MYYSSSMLYKSGCEQYVCNVPGILTTVCHVHQDVCNLPSIIPAVCYTNQAVLRSWYPNNSVPCKNIARGQWAHLVDMG